MNQFSMTKQLERKNKYFFSCISKKNDSSKSDDTGLSTRKIQFICNWFFRCDKLRHQIKNKKKNKTHSHRKYKPEQISLVLFTHYIQHFFLFDWRHQRQFSSCAILSNKNTTENRGKRKILYSNSNRYAADSNAFEAKFKLNERRRQTTTTRKHCMKRVEYIKFHRTTTLNPWIIHISFGRWQQQQQQQQLYRLPQKERKREWWVWFGSWISFLLSLAIRGCW